MKRTPFSAGPAPIRLAPWRNATGLGGTALLIIGFSLLTALAGYLKYAGLDAKILKDVKDCIGKVKTANEGLIAVRELERRPDGSLPPEFEIAANDPNVINIRQCQAVMETLSNDLQTGPKPLRDKLGELGGLIGSALEGVKGCSMNALSDLTAGIDHAPVVIAHIPFTGTDATGSIAMTGAVSGAAPFDSMKAFNWTSKLFISGASSKNAAGGTSTVTAFAAAPSGSPRPDGTCPEGQNRVGDICKISCQVSQSFSWKAPPPPEIVSFAVAPSPIEKGSNANVQLVWTIKNASHASIDQGIGVVNPKTGLTPVLPTPQESTTYTITAIGLVQGVAPASRSVTLKVNESKPLTVNITSPGGNSQVTSNSVAVAGTVSPVPAGGATAQISVNGVPKAGVPVDGAGNFSGSVALAKTTVPSLLNLVNSNLAVGGCGDRSTFVIVQNFNTPSDVENVIAVTVTGGSQQGSASVAVFHAVQLLDFHVDWLSCPPINKNEDRDIVLGPLLQQFIGTVDCGCNNAQNGCHDTCTVQASVLTSLGILVDNATWTFNVPGPCP